MSGNVGQLSRSSINIHSSLKLYGTSDTEKVMFLERRLDQFLMVPSSFLLRSRESQSLATESPRQDGRMPLVWIC